MKKLIAICTIAAISQFVSAKEVIGKSYKFDIPKDVTFKSQNNIDLYTFNWGKSSSIVLTTPLPKGSTQKSMAPFVDMTSSMMEDQFNSMKNVFTKFTKSTNKISFGKFTGTEVKFELTPKAGPVIYTSVIIVWDGESIWNATVTSPEVDAVKRAQTILNSMTKK